MAANFPKKEARLLIENTAEKFKFGDEQKEKVLAFYKKRAYASAYGSGLSISINRGSVTILLNSGEKVPKAKGIDLIGTGGITKEDTGFLKKTFYMSRVYQLKGGFQKSDLVQGAPELNAVTVKFTQSWDGFDKMGERGFLKYVAGYRKAPDLASDKSIKLGTLASINSANKAKEAKDKLVEAAIEMSEIKNEEYALDGFDESRITIDLSSKLFNRLVDERLIVDKAKDTYSGGFFTIGTMGGFKVRRNEFLGKAGIVAHHFKNNADTTSIAEAIIYTDITAVYLQQLLVSMAGKVENLSEDQGYNIEMKYITTENTSDAAATFGAMVYEPLHRVAIAQ